MLKNLIFFSLVLSSFSSHAEGRLTCTFVCMQSEVCDVKQLDPTGQFSNGRAPHAQLRLPLEADDSNRYEIKKDIGNFSIYASAIQDDWNRPRVKIVDRSTLAWAESDMPTVAPFKGGAPNSVAGQVTLGTKAAQNIEGNGPDAVTLFCVFSKQR